MSRFIVAIDPDFLDDALKAIRAVRYVAITGRVERTGGLKIKISAPRLDEEATAVHAIEDIPGVIDLRLARI